MSVTHVTREGNPGLERGWAMHSPKCWCEQEEIQRTAYMSILLGSHHDQLAIADGDYGYILKMQSLRACRRDSGTRCCAQPA